MRRTLFLSGAFIAAPLLAPSAQTVRWNERPEAAWQDQAPHVRIAIVGDRNVPLGGPVLVRFEVSDDAYVTVARVDGNGRLTILYPQARGARAAVKGGQVHYVRNSRLGYDASFVVLDRSFGGYVFALASYVPLDLSGFENRDFERFGGYSRFTQVNRASAAQPDEFVERFAAQVLWDADTPYDFDVDYYFPWGQVTPYNAYALCGAVSRHGYTPVYLRSAIGYDWDSWNLFASPYQALCGNYYRDVRCVSVLSVFGSGTCSWPPYQVAGSPVRPPQDQPGDTVSAPNVGVVRGGLVTPAPVPVESNPGDDPPPLERRNTFDEALRGFTEPNWGSYLSIPTRAARKLKSENESGAEASTPLRAGTEDRRSDAGATFDRATSGSMDRSRLADGGSEPPARVQPARESVKTKPSGTNRRNTGTRSTGTSSGRDRDLGPTMRPTDRSSTGRTTTTPRPAPSIQSTGSGTKKTKPPSDRN